jgi:hypothetical protein
MTGMAWSLVEAAAQLLERDEREAVLGDLMETEAGPSRSLLEVFGLAVRRKAQPWKSWQPWLAAFGLALPGSLFLMGFSLSVSWSFQHFIDPAAPDLLYAKAPMLSSGPTRFLCQFLLLLGWSWTGGFVVGSISRRTIWVSTIACCLPCLFCLTRFHEVSLPSLCLLLFLLPGALGVRQGLRIVQLKLGPAIMLAVVITILTIAAANPSGSWVMLSASIWPAWYIAATARSSG